MTGFFSCLSRKGTQCLGSSMNAPSSSLSMEKGRLKQGNVLEDGIGKDLMNAGRFCFNCEQIFSDRKCLEEHVCSATCYICSCGTEFALYTDMHEHSTTHEPGHQVLDHETIRQRRIEKRKQEEMQLNRIQTGEVIWKAPKYTIGPKSMSASHHTISTTMLKGSIQTAQNSQVPGYTPSALKTSFPQNSNLAPDVHNIFADVGAPTVDLWTVYQPVVLIKTVRQFHKSMPYTCGKCGQHFFTKASLVTHNNNHVTDRVCGCVGCGMLLSSRKVVPRFHNCNAPSSAAKLKVVTAKPPNFKGQTKVSIDMSHNLSVQVPQATSSFQWNMPNQNAGIQAPSLTSNLHSLKHNSIAYSDSNQRCHVNSSLQSKNWSHRASKPYSTLSIPSTNQSQIKRSPPPNPLQCRVCHLIFESAQLLQRHKCAKAREFMAQQGRGGKQHHNLNKMPLTKLGPIQMNGERKPEAPFAGNMKKPQIVTIDLDGPQQPDSVNKKNGDLDDDCYIVESEPDKPAEMIYQVTSSVPIKT